MEVKAFFDAPTFTLTYVVWDEESRDAVVIDSVLNYDPIASQTSTESLDELSDYVRQNGLRVHHVLETHAHADHLSGAQMLRKRFDAKTGIGEGITAVQETFKAVFGFGNELAVDGSQFDKLIADGEVRERLYTLPDETRVFPGHDYMPAGRELAYETTIAKSKAENPHLRADTALEDFVRLRTARDRELEAPRLLYQSVQFNINGGRLPRAEANGIRYFKLPVNMRNPTDEIGEPSR